MLIFSTFALGTISEKLTNDVSVEVAHGFLSVYQTHEGEDQRVYYESLLADRRALGAVFNKYGLERETLIISALADSPLWKHSGNFSRWLHHGGEEQQAGIYFYMDGATPQRSLVQAISVLPQDLNRLLNVQEYIPEDILDKPFKLYEALVKADPLNLVAQGIATTLSYPVLRPGEPLGHGYEAMYAILMEAFVPCFER